MSDANIRLNKVPELIANFLSWAALAGRVLNDSPLVPHICYRGHDRDDWKLLPKLCRDRTELPVDVIKQDEADIIAEFRSSFDFRDWTDTEVMAYAQHHGAPTRLLDWSRNPFVGLWLAVSNARYDGYAGAVYQLGHHFFSPNTTRELPIPRTDPFPRGAAACYFEKINNKLIFLCGCAPMDSKND